MGLSPFNPDGISMTLWGPNSARGRAAAYAPNNPDSTAPNPNPNVFTVVNVVEIGKFVVCKVNYPDATNFEGDKIMVLQGTSLNAVVETQYLDPHFAEDGKVFARFRPDEEGWEAAIAFSSFMTQIHSEDR
jgi:hypothetical protein